MSIDRFQPLPKLRALEIIPIKQQGGVHFVVRDPMRFSNVTMSVTNEAFFIMSLLNGKNTLLDIQSAFLRRFGRILFTEEVEQLLKALDDALFLEDARFFEHKKEVEESFLKNPIRPPMSLLSGYPSSKDEFQNLIKDILNLSKPQKIEAKPIGLIAPHIDYERGKMAYSEAYQAIKEISPKTFLILGTNHFGAGGACVLTLKDFSTPLGIIQTDKEIANALANRLGSKVFDNEIDHRIEHSIELQLPFLQYLFGTKIRIVPILCSLPRDEIVKDPMAIEDYYNFIETLKWLLTEYKDRIFFIAAADLAHIGPQFGSNEPLSDAHLAISKSKDEQMLNALISGETGAFYQFIFSELNERHVCGLAPIDAIDRALSMSRRLLLYYEQWYDINRMSSVSFASVVFTESGEQR